jgi:hypothetical protein
LIAPSTLSWSSSSAVFRSNGKSKSVPWLLGSSQVGVENIMHGKQRTWLQGMTTICCSKGVLTSQRRHNVDCSIAKMDAT